MKNLVFQTLNACLIILLPGLAARGGWLRASGTDTVYFFADSVSGMNGDPVSVKLSASDFTSIVSLQGTISWDPAVIQFDTATSASLPGMSWSNFGTASLSQGMITFSWNDASLNGITLADSAVLFQLNFTLTGNPGAQTEISLEDSALSWEVSDTGFVALPLFKTPGEVMIINPAGIPERNPGGDCSAAVFPNPVQRNESMHILTGPDQSSEPAQFSLLDLQGTTLFRSAPFHRHFFLPEGTISKSGVYILILETSQKICTQLIIAH